MHRSIWTWHGDPDDLAARYEAMAATFPPENMQFFARADTADGIRGLGAATSVVDHPIVAACALGRRIGAGSETSRSVGSVGP